MKTALKTLILAAAVLMVGCKAKNSPTHAMFAPEGEIRRSQEVAAAQVAAGAKEDGILYAWHFDGKDLSPLGREKLDQMAAADSLDTLVVYLDVKQETFGERSKSVNAYLQDKGMAQSHVKVIDGINESTLTPAINGLATLAKTDTGESTNASGGQASPSMVSTK